MPSTVVVSVQYAGGLHRDFELPVDVPVGTLANHIAQAIHSIDEIENPQDVRCMLKRVDKDDVFKREKTLAEYAVVHGEILELIQQASLRNTVTVDEQFRFNGPGFVDSTGLIFKIEKRHVVVGRFKSATDDSGPHMELDLTQVDTVGAPSIAERQAEIRFQSDQFLIKEIAEGGGTIVNLKQLEPHHPVVLRHGDHVSFGDVKLVFVWDGRNPPSA
jgi:uncharacterized ubiquitin-like protein YukD